MVRKRVVSEQEKVVGEKVHVHQKSKCSRCGLSCCVRVSIVLVSLYILTAIAFIKCGWIQRELVYVNRIRLPYFTNLSDPTEFGLHQAKNFYLMHENGCHIGVWYIPQGQTINEANSLKDGSPVILYLHGNTGTRGMSARVGLYKYLSNEKNYHVVTFDYRGFGDSDCHPNELNIMEDGLLVWKWIRKQSPHARIYLWGHSLGSGAATHLAIQLQSLGTTPTAILLDAPFTDITEAAYYHPFGIPFRLLGQRYYQGMHERHASVDRIHLIRSAVMIIHGHGDIIIPFHLGRKLYETAISALDPKDMLKISFVDCGQSSHKYNYLSKELREVIDDFIQ